jgi:hypothetical protein
MRIVVTSTGLSGDYSRRRLLSGSIFFVALVVEATTSSGALAQSTGGAGGESAATRGGVGGAFGAAGGAPAAGAVSGAGGGGGGADGRGGAGGRTSAGAAPGGAAGKPGGTGGAGGAGVGAGGGGGGGGGGSLVTGAGDVSLASAAKSAGGAGGAGGATTGAGSGGGGGAGGYGLALRLAGGAIRNGALAGRNGIFAAGGALRDISGSTSVTVTDGVLDLTGANSYSGDTRIGAGVLRAGGDTALSARSAVIIEGPGALDLAGHDAATGGIDLRGGVIDLRNSARSETLASTFFQASGPAPGVVVMNTLAGNPGVVSGRLAIAGDATGGLTLVRILDADRGPGVWSPFGAVVVSVGGANRGGGFALDPASSRYVNGVIDKGLYRYYLGFSPGAGCDGAVCYRLYSAPTAAALRLPSAITAAQSLWQDTAIMWSDRQSDLRDLALAGKHAPALSSGADRPDRNGVALAPAAATPASGVSLWAQSIGGWTRRENYTSTALGTVFVGNDLSYRQNNLGAIGGADIARDDAVGGRFTLGLIGGYLRSDVTFRAGANWRYEGGTAGLSASYMLRGFFVGGLFQADLLRWTATLPSSGGETETASRVTSFGGAWEFGYHYAWKNLFIEPSTTLTYSGTRIGALQQLAAHGATIGFGGGGDLRGGFGGRVGATIGDPIDGHTLQASFTGRLWQPFDSNRGRTAQIVSGGISQTVGDETFGAAYAELRGHLTLAPVAEGWLAYVSGGARLNEQFSSWTASGGVAYRW